MPNGTDLMGHPSSTQSGVIIPKPDSYGIYYLFTVTSAAEEAGFRYSMIDITLADGLGDVAVKNHLLTTPVTEKVTAVKHRDGSSLWVITHEWESDRFLAYKIDSTGVTDQAVVSAIGSIHQGTTTNTQGYMKASPDGTQIALALEAEHITEFFDFDNLTGKLSNGIQLKLPEKSYNYGIEFSPSGSLLYVSAAGTGKVYQYNLQAGSIQNIQSSETKVGETANKTWIGALQLASDGKIYFPLYKKPYLGSISFPDSVGMACNYNNESVHLGDGLAQLGLPTFTQSFFEGTVVSDSLLYFDTKQKVVFNKEIILKNVLFDSGKASIKSTSFKELDGMVTLLKSDGGQKLKIIGHTDNIGNKSFNLKLSLNRASSVKDYLVNKGIEIERIETAGLGSTSPVRSNTTAEGRQHNRRVTFTLIH
jgi:outer membrane protein OmpA-like peptidoglycan-associated protein